jgi:hypothetical protein
VPKNMPGGEARSARRDLIDQDQRRRQPYHQDGHDHERKKGERRGQEIELEHRRDQNAAPAASIGLARLSSASPRRKSQRQSFPTFSVRGKSAR